MAKLIKRHEPPAETAGRVRSRIQHAQNAGWIWPGNGFDTYRLVAEIYRKAFAVYGKLSFNVY